MIGTALIWTTHNSASGESARTLSLYQYENEDKLDSMVRYNSSIPDWTKVSETNNDGSLHIVYEQVAEYSFIDIESVETLNVKWAKGSSLNLLYHGASGLASETLELDLINGGSRTIADDMTLQITHGVIMWTAWALFASYGIMSSSFRFLYPDGPKWYLLYF